MEEELLESERDDSPVEPRPVIKVTDLHNLSIHPEKW
jgi:hypothetical protein